MIFGEIGLTKQLNRWSKIEGWHQHHCVCLFILCTFWDSIRVQAIYSQIFSVRKNAKKRFFFNEKEFERMIFCQWGRMRKNDFFSKKNFEKTIFFSEKKCEKMIFSVKIGNSVLIKFLIFSFHCKNGLIRFGLIFEKKNVCFMKCPCSQFQMNTCITQSIYW